MNAMLEVKALNVFYGAIHALKGISLSVPAGEIITLIGANGAGKTTALAAISGLVRGRGGEIFYNGRPIQNVPCHRVVALGLAHVPEGRRVFVNLTVKENLMMGGYLEGRQLRTRLAWVLELFPRLKERGGQKAGTLSGGEQQMLALGRGLMSNPKLLMLDEPSLGLAPKLVKDVFRIISEIHAQGVTILLIEQNAKAALGIASYGYVLQTGRITLEGKARDLLAHPAVKVAYLGEAL
jgi:branched-chain amino acid transport system ATP-binding protein